MTGNTPPPSDAPDQPAARIAYRNLPQLLLKAREDLLSHFRPIINHFGLTEQQWRILRTLGERGPMEPWELCEHCQILSPSLAGVLARMDDMGVIHRERVPEDQRRVKVTLSEAGRQVVAGMSPLVQQQYQQLEQALGHELLHDLYTVLDRLVSGSHAEVERIDLSGVPVPERQLGGAQIVVEEAPTRAASAAPAPRARRSRAGSASSAQSTEA